MATGGYTEETANGARLQALLIDEGTPLVRKVFDKEVSRMKPPNLQKQLIRNKGDFMDPSKKILNFDQQKIVYPPNATAANSSEHFDIALLSLLLGILCHVRPPPTGWNQEPPDWDTSPIAWIIRLKLFRNRNYGHITCTALSNTKFKRLWKELADILIGLGGDKDQIHKRKSETIDPEMAKMYRKTFEKLHKEDNEVKDLLTAQHNEVLERLGSLEKKVEEGKKDILDGQKAIITEVGKQSKSSDTEGNQADKAPMEANPNSENTSEQVADGDRRSSRALGDGETQNVPQPSRKDATTQSLSSGESGNNNSDVNGQNSIQQQHRTETNAVVKLEQQKLEGKMPPTIQELRKHLQDRYRRELTRICPLPWCKVLYLDLEHMFTTLKMVRWDGLREDTTVEAENMFQSDKARIVPKTICIEGDPGIGKTTLCYKIIYDCSAENSKFESDNKFASFQLVLYVEMRKIPHDATDIKSSIFKQAFPTDYCKDGIEEEFWDYVRRNNEAVLFVLDGLDEMPEETRENLKITEFIRGQITPGVYVIVTSRPYLCNRQLTHCNRHFVIKGYSRENIKSYIQKHQKLDPNSKEGMLQQLTENENLHQLTENPLNLALLCILWQEDWNNADLPQTLTGLYSLLVVAIVKRYASNCLGINELSGTCLGEIKEPNIRGMLDGLNCLAWKGIREDRLNFPIEEVGSLVDVQIGFLTKGLNVTNPLQSCWFQFLHKTFQEYFAAWQLHSLAIATSATENTSMSTLSHIASYFRTSNLSKEAMNTLKECVEKHDRYRQVLKFLAGLLGPDACCLFEAFHDCLSKNQDEEIVSLCLECLHECEAGTDLARYVSEVLPRDWHVGSDIQVEATGQPELLSHLFICTHHECAEKNQLPWRNPRYQLDYRHMLVEAFGTCRLSCNTYMFSDQTVRKFNPVHIRSNEALYGLVYLLQYQAQINSGQDNLQLSSVELRHGLDNSTFFKAIKHTKVICFLAIDITNSDDKFIEETCNLFKSDAYKDLTCSVSMSPSGNSSLDNLNKVLLSVPAQTELSMYSSVYLRNDSRNKDTFSRVIDTTVRLGSVVREREASIWLSVDCASSKLIIHQDEEEYDDDCAPRACKYETEFVSSFMQTLVTTLKECQSLHQQGSLDLLVIVRSLPLAEKPKVQSLVAGLSSLLEDNYCLLSKMTFECSCVDDSIVSTTSLLQSLVMNQSLTEVSILCDDPHNVAESLQNVFAKNKTLQKLEIGFLHPVDDKTMSNIFSSYPVDNQGPIHSFSVIMETGRNPPHNSTNTTVINNPDSYEQTIRAILYICKNLCDGSALQNISFISGPGNTLMKTGALYRVHKVIPVCPGSLLKPLVEAIVDSQLTVNLEGITWENVTDIEVKKQERSRYSDSEHYKKSKLGQADTGVAISNMFGS